MAYSAGTGSHPQAVTVNDVNNDNIPDIIVGNNGGNSVGIFLNLGSGTFSSQTAYPTGSGSGPYSVSVMDVNSDNKPDIVVANSGTDNIIVLFNSGS
ncbi:unnamed protein product, partial [Didymodactylos carnosus]